MNIAIPIFEKLTVLDAVGPYEVLSRLPGATVHFVAKETGPKRAETGMLALMADRTLDELPEPDVIVVPGGYGNRPLMEDEEVLSWLRHAHEQSKWTTSVCTGALVLAAAGILDGLEATTHWLCLDALAKYGAIPVGDRRVVEQGKVLTAAGVSAGIDMALHLVARLTDEATARQIQLELEYDPQPPLGRIDWAHMSALPRVFRGSISLAAPFLARRPRRLTALGR
jgi:transcriptional regulator GlxA family with amidase domain